MRLTDAQLWTLIGACVPMPDHRFPHDVHRSLVIRGLMTSKNEITPEGREALAQSVKLSLKFRMAAAQMSTPKFSAFEKHREALREVEMRKEVYGRNAPGGVLYSAQLRRIAIMEEIAEDYRVLAEKERLL